LVKREEGGETAVEWRKLLNEKLSDLKPRRKQWAGRRSCRGKSTYAYDILVGKPEGE
jgi:hypothetical protein